MRENEKSLTEVSGGYSDEAPSSSGPPDRAPLFRPEALAAQNELRWGRPVAIMPVSWGVIVCLLAAIAVAAAVLLGTMQISRKETVRGMVRPLGGEVRIVAEKGGILRDLRVGDGSLVAPGQVLGVVSTTHTSDTGADSSRTVLAALLVEENALHARLAAFDAGQPLATSAAQADIAAIAAEREAAQQAILTNEERRVLAEERVAAANTLAEKGLISGEELRRRQEAVLALDQAIADSRARVASFTAKLIQARSALSKLPHDAVVTRGALEESLASLIQRRAQAEAAIGYEIRAPIAGRVTALQAVVGQRIDSAHPLMMVAPDDARLVAELYVPSRAIGFVKNGQRVRLLFDAFPYQRFGASFGVVSVVSQTVLMPSELQSAVTVTEPVYRVLVRLDDAKMNNAVQETKITSGMALTADIVLETRSIADWLLAPLYAARRRL